MTKIITDKGQVNNYLLSRNKAAEQAQQHKQRVYKQRLAAEMEIVNDPEEAEYRIKDSILAQKIGFELCHAYPGHGWEVEVDIRNGIAKIFNVHLSGLNGYLLHLKKISLSSFKQDIVRIGGELLEAFGVSRGKFDQDEIMNLERDRTGGVKVDLP